jgi:TRAP-type C4-dicarboxylate transport system permease small subunit
MKVDSDHNANGVANGGRRKAGLWQIFETRILLNIATAMFLIACGVMLFEGGSRAFLNSSAFWAEESVRYLMVWAFFLTLGMAGRAGHHIRTDLLVTHLGPRMQRVMNLLASLLGIGFCGLLFAASVPQLQRYYSMGMMTESNLDLPLWTLFMIMPIGALIFMLYYIGCLVRTCKGEDPFASEQPSNGPQI